MSQPFPDFDFQQLDPSQRLDLITQLWDSIPNSIESIPVPEWHQNELEQRIANADTAPETALPWEEVRNRLREKP